MPFTTVPQKEQRQYRYQIRLNMVWNVWKIMFGIVFPIEKAIFSRHSMQGLSINRLHRKTSLRHHDMMS